MSLRTTLILVLVLAALGGYLYFVEIPRGEQQERADQLVAISADDVRKLEILRDEEAIELARGAGEEWQLLRPVTARADAAGVRSLLSAITDASIARTLSDAGEPESFGLVAGAITVRLTAVDGAVTSIAVGRSAPVGNHVYVQREGEASILLADAGFRTSIDKSVDELRDKRILEFEDDDVQWIEIAKPSRQARIERRHEGWQVTGEPSHPGDATAIQTYLSSLRSLRVASFVDDSPADLGAYGLDEPRLTVRIGLRGDREETLLFGTTKAATEYHAQASIGANVFTVHDWAYRNLDKGTRDLRDKTLFALEAQTVQVVDVRRRDGTTFRLARDGDVGWTIDGETGSVDVSEVNQFVEDVVNLAGYEIVADQADDLARFGLDEPLLEIGLFGGDDAPLGAVTFGKTIADDGIHHFHAKSDHAAMIVLVRSYVFNRLDKKPENFVAGGPEASNDGDAADDPHAGHGH